ncbi:hypothetical protein MA16_Dca002927 [Dendrobium catenatum]|uniref:Uncharacterized protein n=1 Tax=Dendrobium catenatum TaxID=906689 RepID=A0A2I0X941_9ASPA|nr:hypothetical protein MA16_Dca002927 [Dendrobium catenatum]
MSDVLMQAEVMESEVKGELVSSGCAEVRNMTDNPVFESDTCHFTFGGMKNLEDLKKRIAEGYVLGSRGDNENFKLRIDFAVLGKLPEVQMNDLVARGDCVDLVGSDSFKSAPQSQDVNQWQVQMENLGGLVHPHVEVQSILKNLNEMLWEKARIDMQSVDQVSASRPDGQPLIVGSVSLPVVKKKNWREPKDSPAQLLAPRALKFSDAKAGVIKGKNKKDRDSKECHTKEMTLIVLLQKLPGRRRSKNLKNEVASSCIEQFVNVVDKSIDSKLKEVDLADQGQDVFSEVLKFSENSAEVVNPKRKQNRNCTAAQEIANIGSVLKLTRMMRDKDTKFKMDTSFMEHLGNVRNKSDGNKDGSISLTSEVVCVVVNGNRNAPDLHGDASGNLSGGDASPLVINAKSATPLGVREEKGLKPHGAARHGKENAQGLNKTTTHKTSLAAMKEALSTTFTTQKGKFEMGLSSPISKPTAVRELIMSSIGISPPVVASRDVKVGQSFDVAQGDEDDSCSSGGSSPHMSSCGMENEKLETSDREAGVASDIEDSAGALGSQINMEDDQGDRAK